MKACFHWQKNCYQNSFVRLSAEIQNRANRRIMTGRPSSKQIMERLLPQPESVVGREQDFITDLTTKTFLTIPISDLETYDKNPRRMLNPNFDEIKESISNDGINQPLVVTQRPDSDKFMIYKGGNTRLKALQELYNETGDRKYRFVDCTFHPWSGYESDAIIGHLQENQMRKSLCFIDRAFGTKLAIEHLKQESDRNDMSLRDFRAILARRGYSTTISSLSVMLYAIDNVEPLLPRNISITMGRPQVQKLRSLENAFRKVCSEFNISNGTAISIFTKTLEGYDSLQWSLSIFRRSLEAVLSNTQSISIHDIALRIDGYLHVSATPLNNSPEAINTDLIRFDQVGWMDECTKIKPETSVRSENSGNAPQQSHQIGALQTIDSIATDQNQVADEPNSRIAIFPFESKGASNKSQADLDMEKLRQQTYQTAFRIAKRYDLHENSETNNPIVTNIGNWGIGFLITDYPKAASSTALNLVGVRDALWWILVELCDLQWATERARPVIAKLVGNSKLLHFVKSGNSQSLSLHAKGVMKCTYPHLSLLCFCLRQLDESSWNDVNHLNTLYRAIHHLARNNGIQLFQQIKQGIKQ